MKSALVPIQIRLIFPSQSGCAIFLGNDEKTFVIQVEPQMGHIIGMFIRGQAKERPLTHDLMQHVFKGFGITVDRIVITDLRNGTFYARLFLQQENELGKKIVEIDARPSDCLALAAAQKRPILATRNLLDNVEDMSAELEKFGESGPEPE
jgi:bifunctional DNase/RNase